MKVPPGEQIRLPVTLDRQSAGELRARIERLGGGASITIDGTELAHVETTGVQLLCALVLAAEGRGVGVSWRRVPATLVNYVKMLGIGDVLRIDGGPPDRRRGPG